MGMRRILVAALAIAAIGTPTAHASDDDLPLPDFGDILVDHAHKRVFISGGPSSNSVAVTDYQGRVQRVINNQFGASGLELSADGRTVYVALAAGDAISAIDTTKLIETARYSSGAQTCPTHLARTGAFLWFGYSCDDDWNGRIGRLDTAVAPPTITLDRQGSARFQRAPLVTATGADSGPVVAGQTEVSLANVRTFSVTAGELAPGASGEVVGSNLTDLAVSPDNATLYSAAGSRGQVDAFATSDLSRRGAYATGVYPNAVDVSPDGRYLATGIFTTRSKAISIYPVGSTTPVTQVTANGLVLASRGLAWSGDNSRLFAIFQGITDARPRLSSFSI